MSFKRSDAFVAVAEGGWADDKFDKGGKTRFGFSSRAHPNIDLDKLTPEKASNLRRDLYWGPAHCEELPWPVALPCYDLAIHSGVKRSVQTLQRAVGATADGRFGERTRDAVLKYLDTRTPQQLAMACLHRRRLFMVRGFRMGWFSPAQPLRFLNNFWKRTLNLAYEIGRN